MLTIMISSYSFFSGTDNDRYVCLTFQNADAPTLIHGLAGYFDTQLYGEITLSEDILTNFLKYFSYCRYFATDSYKRDDQLVPYFFPF